MAGAVLQGPVRGTEPTPRPGELGSKAFTGHACPSRCNSSESRPSLQDMTLCPKQLCWSSPDGKDFFPNLKKTKKTHQSGKRPLQFD